MGIPSYRYQPGINGLGDASLGPQYVFFPEKLNDADAITNYGYNSTLLNKAAKFGSQTDVTDAENLNGMQFYARQSWRAAIDRNKFGISSPVFSNAQEYFDYIAARIAEQDDLKDNFTYVNWQGAGINNSLYVLNPRYDFGGSAMSKTQYHDYQYPRLSGLYDTDLAVNTNLIQIGYLAQTAWFHLNSAIIPQAPAFWYLYSNTSNVGSARFKAINESFFFGADNSNTSLKTQAYKQMRNSIQQNIRNYKNNYNSSPRMRDSFFYHDNRIVKYVYARRKTKILDPVAAGFSQSLTSPYWQYLNRRVDSLDCWIYASGSWNTSTKEYSLDNNYLYFRLANAQTGSFDRSRLPNSIAAGATEGAIYR